MTLSLAAIFKAIRDSISFRPGWTWFDRLPKSVFDFLMKKSGRWLPLDGWHTFDGLSYLTLYSYGLVVTNGLAWALLWQIPLSWEVFYFVFGFSYHVGLMKPDRREFWIAKSLNFIFIEFYKKVSNIIVQKK
jgi:hypothetical protein